MHNLFSGKSLKPLKFLLLSSVLIILNFTAFTQKITLNASAITGYGNIGVLADNQTLDPKINPAGKDSNGENYSIADANGYLNPAYMPPTLVFDLGSEHALTDIYYYFNDGASANENLDFYAGSPNNWEATPFYTNNAQGYQSWKGGATSKTTRYIKLVLANTNVKIRELILYGTNTNTGGGGGTTNTLTISTNTVNFPNTASASSTINVSSNTSWTISSNQSWLSTNVSSGTNNGSFTVSAMANGGTASRTGQLTIQAASLTQIVTVNQAGTVVIPINNGKIPLNTSMTYRLGARGVAEYLVNENNAVDPKANPSIKPTVLNKGFTLAEVNGALKTEFLPITAIIDLERDYLLSDVYIYLNNGAGSQSVYFYAGNPSAWEPTAFATIDGNGYQNWKNASNLTKTTRYIRAEITQANLNIIEMVLYGSAVGVDPVMQPVTGTVPAKQTMWNFAGSNIFGDAPQNLVTVSGMNRIYTDYAWISSDETNTYPNKTYEFTKFDAVGGANFDNELLFLKNNGETFLCMQGADAQYISANSGLAHPKEYKPVAAGANTYLPASYIDHADGMYQIAARYGKTAVPFSILKLKPKANGLNPPRSGLGYLNFLENGNENNKDWFGNLAHFNAFEYAAMSSADYDGHENTLGANLGMKNADPTIKMVMSATISIDTNYIKTMDLWTRTNRGDKKFVWDVINFHHYSNDAGGQVGTWTTGITPEADNLYTKLSEYVSFCRKRWPEKEIWWSEFGYDITTASPQHTPTIAGQTPEQVQANLIVRSFMIATAAGIDRAHQYMLRNANYGSNNGLFLDSGLYTGGLYVSPGVFTSNVARPSWYAMYTMRNALKNYVFDSRQPAPAGQPNVYVYKFKHNTVADSVAYVVWSGTSNNSIINNLNIDLPNTMPSIVVKPNYTTIFGNKTLISNPTANQVTLTVTEEPQYILGKSTSSTTTGIASATNGSWHQAGTWQSNTVPTAQTDVIVRHAVTVSQNAEAKSVAIETAQGSITLQNSSVLNINNSVTNSSFNLNNVKSLADQHYFVVDGKQNANGTGAIQPGSVIRSIQGKAGAPGGLCVYKSEAEISLNDAIPNRTYTGDTGGLPRYFAQNGGYLSIANGTAISYTNSTSFATTAAFEEIHVLRLHGGQRYEAIISSQGNGYYNDFKSWANGTFQYRPWAYGDVNKAYFDYNYNDYTTILLGFKTDPATGTCNIWLTDDQNNMTTKYSGPIPTGHEFQFRSVGTSNHPHSFDWFGSCYKLGSFFSETDRTAINDNLKAVYSVGQTPAKSFARPTIAASGSVYTVTPNYVLKNGATSIDPANTKVHWYQMDKRTNGINHADPFQHIKLVATTTGNQLSLDTTTIPGFELGIDQLFASIFVYDNLGQGFERDCETNK
jgi:hypothetical protein